MFRQLFCTIAFVILMSGVLLGESKRTIMVFYPSPYGEYKELRTGVLVVGEGSSPNYMDATQVYAPEEGIVYIRRGLVIGEYSTNVATSLPEITNAGTVRLRIVADGPVPIGGVPTALTYTQHGYLILGQVDEVPANSYPVIYATTPGTVGPVSLTAVLGEFDFSFAGPTYYSGTGLKLNLPDEENKIVLASDSINNINLRIDKDNSEISMGIDEKSGQNVYHLSSTDSLLIDSKGGKPISVVGGQFYVSPEDIDPTNLDNPSGHVGDSVVFIRGTDDTRSALYWADDTNGVIGYLGADTQLHAATVGSSSSGTYQKLLLAGGNGPAIGINEQGRVVVGDVSGTIGALDSVLFVSGDNSIDQLIVSSGGNALKVTRNGYTVIGSITDTPSAYLTVHAVGALRPLVVAKGGSGITVDDNGNLVVGSTTDSAGYIGGEQTKLDVRGYVVVDDIYIRNPKSGDSPDWVSNFGKIDYSDCVYTSDSRAANCPANYVAIGFDCTGSCGGSNMELRCCRLK